ncbi:unnamed protein product, partial [Prorocentrum cordatum]
QEAPRRRARRRAVPARQPGACGGLLARRRCPGGGHRADVPHIARQGVDAGEAGHRLSLRISPRRGAGGCHGAVQWPRARASSRDDAGRCDVHGHGAPARYGSAQAPDREGLVARWCGCAVAASMACSPNSD